MKSALFVLITGACLFGQQQGSLEGTAINALTREPLSNVHVQLINAGFSGINGAYGAMTDRAGHFSILTIRPGTYILLPQKPGFLHIQTKEGASIPTLTIKPGEATKAYTLEMTPRAVLAGRVVDEAGDPVMGIMVQAVAANPDSAPVILNTQGSIQTDDRGEFRIVAAPGKYYLQATVNQYNSMDRPEARSDGTTEIVYATTFYPSSPRKDRGNVVDAVAGKESSGLEIRLARQQRGLSISGTVTGYPEGGTSRPTVMMYYGDKAPTIRGARSTGVANDGKFRFDALQPGYFKVFAQYQDGKTVLMSETREWTLDTTEVTNVDLVLGPMLDISGKVTVEGDSSGGRRSVKLEPTTGFVMGPVNRSGGDVDAEGMYKITGVAPGKYRLKVDGLPETSYVKTVEVDGAKQAGGLVDFSNTRRGATVNLTAGRGAVQISGHVLDPNGERMGANVVMIFLVQDFADVMATNNGTTQAQQDGTYTLKSVAPGKYKLFAVDAFRVSGANAPDLVRAMYDRAEEVEFHEGQKITKDLRVMAKEDPNAKK